MHLGKLELRLSARSAGERGIADDVAECLSVGEAWLANGWKVTEQPKTIGIRGERDRKRNTFLSRTSRKPSCGDVSAQALGTVGGAYRFVWSRMVLMLMKPLMSSFFARN